MLFSLNPADWIILEETPSTNSYLLDQNFVSGCCCLANYQTSGRGRLGKSWVSQAGHGFLFSALLVFDPDNHPDFISFLAILSALSLVEALQVILDEAKPQRLAQDSFRIKWPNDILLKKDSSWGKLAGILLESSLMENKLRLVIGIGLNWKGSAPDVQKNLFEPVSIEALSSNHKPVDFIPYLLARLNANLILFYDDKIPELIEKIHPYLYGLGKQVAFRHQRYTVAGLGSAGELILNGDGGPNTSVHHVDEAIDWKLVNE